MRESRKHGCFHVIGAANPAEGLQKLAISPLIAIAEGYATAAAVAKYGHVPAIAAFDSGNLLAVATALHERWPQRYFSQRVGNNTPILFIRDSLKFGDFIHSHRFSEREVANDYEQAVALSLLILASEFIGM
jgi:Catalase